MMMVALCLTEESSGKSSWICLQHHPKIDPIYSLWKCDKKIGQGSPPRPPSPSPNLFNIQFVKIGQQIWAGPPPLHLDQIQKNSNFFRETVPKELWEKTPGSPWHIWCRNGSRGSRPEGPEWRPPSPPPPCSWQKDWAPTEKGVQLLVCNACDAECDVLVSNISPFYGFSIAITKIGLKKEVGIDMRMFGIVKIALVSKIKKKLAQSKFWSCLFMMATW